MHTNTNQLISWALLASIVLMSGASAASTIGSGSVTGSSALTQNVVWDDAFPGTATGTVTGINVKAKILPTLNMVVDGNGEIDLGTLSASAYSSGTVNIEVGTNAKNGAAVTASSTNGGLKSGTDYINSLNTDGVADSYKFSSAIWAANDSAFSTFNQSASYDAEVNDTTPRTLYTSDKPQALDGVNDFSFTVSAKPNAQSPAGDYTDELALTVVGKF